jgi:glutamine synthetase type III
VDSIQNVLWSPDSGLVVFHSRDYLTATRVSDWQTIRVFLGKEWTRHRPDRRSTFSSGGQGAVVEAIGFPAPDGFSYRLKGQAQAPTVHFAPPLARAQ